jgi:predicted nucleic-acid-binding protein
MIALDTNILARFYVDDPGDPEAAKQRPVAFDVISKGPSLFVPLTVILELEWVLRAFYRFDAVRVIQVVEHLLGLSNVNVEESSRVLAALELFGRGMDFADALHLVSSGHCEALFTFDDRRFALRAQRLGTDTKVIVPGSDQDLAAGAGDSHPQQPVGLSRCRAAGTLGTRRK